MDCMLLHPGKRSLTNDIMSGNPSKRIRLEFKHKKDINEDLWGQEDLTAEEFDMLEIQATQSCNTTVNFPNYNAIRDSSKYFDGQSNTTEVEDLKQQQYELEGRVKILSLSLERATKELNEERLNRDRTINDRMKECRERESNLQKEVERIKSVLEFKEQEMKSVYSKLQVLKLQVPDKKSSCAETFINKEFEDFLTRPKPTHNDTEVLHKLNSTHRFRRKNKLLVDSPRGEAASIDIVSSILCNRLSIPAIASSENTTNGSYSGGETATNFAFTPISVVQFKSELNSDELLRHYQSILDNHIRHLKTLVTQENAGGNAVKMSPMSTRRKEANCVCSPTVISCLDDVVCLLSSLKMNRVVRKQDDNKRLMPSNKKDGSPEETRLDPSAESLSGILESLMALSNPSIFPNGYSRTEEMELSLSALFNICLLCPEMFLDKVSELPIHLILDPHPSLTSVCTTLKLMTSLCESVKFASHLVHKESLCVLCSVAGFLCSSVRQYPEKFSVSMVLVEDFLSSILSVHNLSWIQLQTSQCVSEVVKGVVRSIWKYYRLKDRISSSTVIIKKGFFLLHFMSARVPNFKERRSQVEDEYVYLVSSLLTLTKENTEFRELYDLIHDMWDFQTDVSEFDLDEQSDETQTSSNEMDTTDGM